MNNNKPFILNFIEYFKPQDSIGNYTRYSDKLNLNVLNATDVPAVAVLNVESETFTKVSFEDTDCYGKPRLNLRDLLTLETVTESIETTDKSHNICNRFASLLEGETITLVSYEPTDKSIKSSIRNIISLLQSETNTRSYQEPTDLK